MTRIGAAFENFDAVVGVGVVGGGDVDSVIIAHFIETVINGGGGKDAGTRIFKAEGFAGGA